MTPLPNSLNQYFADRGTLRSIREGAVILHAGDPCTHVYLIETGKVRFSLLSQAGREPILSEGGAGTVFGELAAIDDLPRAAIASAVTDTRLRVLSQSDFLAHLQANWDSALWVMRHLGGLLRDQTDATFRLSTLPVSARLAHTILSFVRPDKNGERAVVRDLPTHSDLAARIGSHREAITRELSKWRKKGLVEQTGRTLNVLDINALQMMAEVDG